MTNRLRGAASPYLRAAARQPVDWFPWCEEAFERARREDKPVLLDIGAAWCHWCHVMDHESYDDPQIAAFINEHFVPVKVDRDERPDVDVRYQNAVAALSGQGGWPLTVFLTPDGYAFYGGTYFPKEDRYGRPGFLRVLQGVAEAYRRQRDRTREVAAQLAQELRRAQTATDPGPVSLQMVEDVLDGIARAFDARYGGFGTAPKFPHASALDLVLYHFGYRREEWMEVVARHTLRAMAHGGIYDQLGGGFHRYSTDARWCVPHFEKMLYDNAALLATYSRAYLLWRDPLYAEVVEGTAGFLLDVLADPAGGFGASQDADTGPGDDGDYFTWTVDEAAALLEPDELEVVRRRFDLHEQGEMHHDPRRNVLWVAASVEEVAAQLGWDVPRVQKLLQSAVRKLRHGRSARSAPAVDRTLYAAWNGMAATALLVAHQATAVERYAQAALRTVDRFLREGFDPARGFSHALHEPQGPRTLDDQVHMGYALLLAYSLTGERRHLDAAREVAALLDREYHDPAEGGFFDVPRSQARGPALELPYKPIQDAPTPSGNGVAALFLQDLSALSGEVRWAERAEEVVRTFAGVARAHGYFAATYSLAASRSLQPPVHVVVAGGRHDPAARALHRAAWSAAHPDRVVSWAEPGQELPEPARSAAEAAAGGSTAFVCVGNSCAPPVADPEALRRTLEASPAR
ncbi:MAG: thioredoxin domain-containing protein [Armatimonadota bacterium]|nr:thioredoxin domain-containing protein [Armatimonadota bacterium]MDW8155060.1 thioredoxin domain-containing protein [Armatimonadota bacterium]